MKGTGRYLGVDRPLPQSQRQPGQPPDAGPGPVPPADRNRARLRYAPAPRSRTLTDIATLPQARQATLDEVRGFIERKKLYGLGCGVVDLALLASTLLTPGSRLWSLDRRLVELAQRFDIAFQPALQ
jgi:hypothetical protein